MVRKMHETYTSTPDAVSSPATNADATTRLMDRQFDHRTIGHCQQLFMMDECAPGQAFILPHGARVINRLMAWMRELNARQGIDEVISPIVFDRGLWVQSGHAQHYEDQMYEVSTRSSASIWGLKPMNCPVRSPPPPTHPCTERFTFGALTPNVDRRIARCSAT